MELSYWFVDSNNRNETNSIIYFVEQIKKQTNPRIGEYSYVNRGHNSKHQILKQHQDGLLQYIGDKLVSMSDVSGKPITIAVMNAGKERLLRLCEYSTTNNFVTFHRRFKKEKASEDRDEDHNAPGSEHGRSGGCGVVTERQSQN